MSNEKLGAEQGRVTPKGAENVCPVCYHDFADCPCPFEVKPAEPAHHARGAGRELCEKLEFRRQYFHHLYCTFRKAEVEDETGQTKNGWEIYLAHVNELDAVLSLLREPGADTGTTPPRDAELQEAYEEGVQDGMDEEAALAKAAERGTTPPEGPACGGSMHERGEGCADCRDYAATQRAPVEQGREITDVCGHEFWAAGNEKLGIPRMMLDQCELSRGHAGRHQCGAASWDAPDHAREGALLREAKWWYKEFVWPWRADDEDSDDRARKRLAALADGKEGGE